MPRAPAGLKAPPAFRSGVGRAAPVVPLEPPWIRKWPFAGTVPLSATTPLGAAVPVAERYCRDQPSREIGVSVGLYSSTNLWVKTAFAEPPLV